jgi:hypothetical protein
VTSLPFRFNAAQHVYIALDTGEVVPNITRMIETAEKVDKSRYTEESRRRGTFVHKHTAMHDLDALDPALLMGHRYEGYVLAHIELMGIVRPEWKHIEVAAVHPRYRYGGTCDRVGLVYSDPSVWEIKTGDPSPHYMRQTALQAILAAEDLGLEAKKVQRFAAYLSADGRYKLEHHTNVGDFDRAYRYIRDCRRAA